MKASIALTATAALIASVSASCFSEREGLGYPCCKYTNKVIYIDEDGDWGIERNEWCSMPDTTNKYKCWANDLGYPCCESSDPTVYYTDKDGDWSVENDDWCGIIPKPVKKEEEKKDKQQTSNLYKGRALSYNSFHLEKIDEAISKMTDDTLRQKAEKMKRYSTALWFDSIKNIRDVATHFSDATFLSREKDKEYVATVVLYNLPGRDCHALASDGELLPNDTDFGRYKNEYIKQVGKALKYAEQPVVFIVEPGSLASLVTFKETTPACAEAERYYLDAHAYLIKMLGIYPNVSLYLDIGHSFWLGWDDTRKAAASLYASVIKSGSPGLVRGFADNITSYNPWMDFDITIGPENDFNPCPDEKRYIKAIHQDFTEAGIKNVYFVYDSSIVRVKSESNDGWCRKSVLGVSAPPNIIPVNDVDYVDAFLWIKPVGESVYLNSIINPFENYCGEIPEKSKEEFDQEFFEEAIENAYPPL